MHNKMNLKVVSNKMKTMQIDEGRAELPLTADKQDTFPIGLALETGCTHQLVIGKISFE